MGEAVARLVDSHAHLQSEAFERDRDAVLAAARAAGVERILIPGWDLASSRGGLALATAHRWLDAAVGIHPHAAAGSDEDAWADVVELAVDPRVVAIGETGLDYDRMLSPREAQLANLRRHLDLALVTGKPLVLHCRSRAGARDAQDELLREMRAAGVGGEAWHDRFGERPPAVLHSFSGPPDYAEAAIGLGAAISFSGLIFRAGEEASADVARMVPGDRLLVETDAPYLSPPGAPRRRNAPAWIRITADRLAVVRANEPPAALGERLAANHERIFGAGPAGQSPGDPIISASAS